MIGCLRQLISGGQTGADRGGLDAALAHGLEIGGWAPQGFRAEDGVIPERYRVHMRESVSPNYGLRTRLNVQDSDGTLLLSFASTLTGGSKFTVDHVKHQRKPCKHLVLPRGRGVVPVEVTLALWDWLEEQRIGVLNIAGPRESKERGLQAAVERTIGDLLKAKASAATSAVLAFCDARDAAHFTVTSRVLTKAEEDHLFRSAFANNGEGIKEAAKTGVLRLVCEVCGERDGCGCAMRAYAAEVMAGAKTAIEREDEIRASGKYREAGGPIVGLSGISPTERGPRPVIENWMLEVVPSSPFAGIERSVEKPKPRVFDADENDEYAERVRTAGALVKAGLGPIDPATVVFKPGKPIKPSLLEEPDIAMRCECGGYLVYCPPTCAHDFVRKCSMQTDPDALRGLIGRYRHDLGGYLEALGIPGGSFHVVFDDKNHDRSDVEHARASAIADGDIAGEALADALLALPDDVFDQVLPPFADQCLDCGAEHPHLCPRAEDSDPEPYHRDEEPRE